MGITKYTRNGESGMESGEAVAIPQAFCLDGFWHRSTCRQPVTTKLTKNPLKPASTRKIRPFFTHSVGRRPEFIWCNAPQNTSVNLMSASRADLKSVISGCLAMQKKK
jgi:hypothetical protein